ncbi:phosphate ABC transporter substrate-binding protein [Paenibacillus sp. N1-5-1-14]|uniref:phosphate ABC transporter substrate-binding protein n=1 Tax=Paenibacillus radicibacter TaxID=2972488 RepID=UPI00215935B7|nr:phosphate ABC transporter substrate-binding protein [Paenibacillus radicibacter]MCR8643739.1 phosphate ABC transporter substrate-binding protein [Paenibacillus radicibacter]
MFKQSKVFAISMSIVLSMGLLAGCGNKEEAKTGNSTTTTPPAKTEEISGTVTASGSSALLPLVKQAATEFQDKHAKVTVNVTAGGSGTGLKNVADGTSNIGNSDVEAGDEYKDKGLVDHIVAIAPFALIVNKDVNIENLTKQQAADIFTGKITNWKEVGGADKKITLVHRPDSSGSRKLVKQVVLGSADFSKDGITQESSGAMKTAVAQTSGSIGYVDAPYIDAEVKALKFDGVAYAKETIKDGSYKLFGMEHMYTKGEATGAVKAFIDYILSPEFQSTRVEELKFLPATFLKK